MRPEGPRGEGGPLRVPPGCWDAAEEAGFCQAPSLQVQAACLRLGMRRKGHCRESWTWGSEMCLDDCLSVQEAGNQEAWV